MYRKVIGATTLALCALSVHGHDYAIQKLHIGHPYARATPPGATTAGAYLSIENKGTTADRLLRVVSPIAGLGELHSMSMDGSVMRMRAVPSIEIPAGATVKFAPGGLHVMLQDLKRPLKQGDRVPVILTFERAGEAKVELSVTDMAGGSGGNQAHGGQGAHGGMDMGRK